MLCACPLCPPALQEWRIEDLQGQVSDLRQEAAALAAATDAATARAAELGEQLAQRGADLEAAVLRAEDLAAQVRLPAPYVQAGCWPRISQGPGVLLLPSAHAPCS